MVSMKFCNQKKKVVVVMGATATGKSKLAIDLAKNFDAEIINSDKIQVYHGLDIITNKVTWEERSDVPHHLLGCLHPDEDFTASDFRRVVTMLIESITARGRLPIIAGGSNTYIEELIDGNNKEFRSNYECCFLWVHVEKPVLQSYISYRVDKMVEMGVVEEIKENFDPNRWDYSRGIHRAIGVPEMDPYFRSDDKEKADLLLAKAIEDTKINTFKLACYQIQKIHRLRTLPGWNIHRIDATDVLKKSDKEAEETYEATVGAPSRKIVMMFLHEDFDKLTTIDNFEN